MGGGHRRQVAEADDRRIARNLQLGAGRLPLGQADAVGRDLSAGAGGATHRHRQWPGCPLAQSRLNLAVAQIVQLQRQGYRVVRQIQGGQGRQIGEEAGGQTRQTRVSQLQTSQGWRATPTAGRRTDCCQTGSVSASRCCRRTRCWESGWRSGCCPPATTPPRQPDRRAGRRSGGGQRIVGQISSVRLPSELNTLAGRPLAVSEFSLRSSTSRLDNPEKSLATSAVNLGEGSLTSRVPRVWRACCLSPARNHRKRPACLCSSVWPPARRALGRCDRSEEEGCHRQLRRCG